MFSDRIKRVGELSYDRKKVIGVGHYGTIVFSGLFRKKLPVAVKRVRRETRDSSLIYEEMEIMSKIGNHPNFLRYFCMEMDEDFKYSTKKLWNHK